MVKIKIQRNDEFSNRMRNYKIFIDGKEAGIIANGETKEFETVAGQHTVTAKIDWCSSPDILINIGHNETKNLKVGGFKYGNWLAPLGIGIIVLHLILSNTIDFKFTLLLLVPAFLLLVYYLSFGRRKYLTLREIND